MSEPFVNIFMVAYNHEPYIAQAIESVLVQKTNFDYQLVIGEDCSTDGTRDIVKKYADKYPNKIKAILNSKNIGAMPNADQVFKACTGKYIAMLEGDDYWTDPYKLQKQVDFLERNMDFAICFHKVMFEYENDPDRKQFSNINQKDVTTIEELAQGNYIYTASCIFRNRLSKLPDWFFQCPIGDYPLHLFNAQYGKIKFINEIMGVYRIHQGGVWSTKNWANTLEKWADLLDIMKDKFDDNINRLINNALNFTYSRLARGYCLHNRDSEKVKFYLKKIKTNKPDYLDIILKNIKFLINSKSANKS